MKWNQIEDKWAAMTRRIRSDRNDDTGSSDRTRVTLPIPETPSGKVASDTGAGSANLPQNP